MEIAVSIMMPVYNAQDFLTEALQSALDQTHQRFELLAPDDGSTDQSFEVLAEFARCDKRIITWRQENRGLAATLNECLQRATNELVVRVDADDVMLPNRLARQSWFMQCHPEISVATSYAWLINRRGTLLARARPMIDIDRGIKEMNPTYFVNLIHPATIMRKTDINAVGGYSTQYRFAEDRELWGRVVASGRRLAVQKEFLVKQRLHHSSLTGKRMRRNILIGRYIDHNIIRSLHGKQHISLEAFLEYQRNLPYLVRAAQDIKDLGEMYYREATRDFAERDWLRFLQHSMSAVCLRPALAVRMLEKIVLREPGASAQDRTMN